MAAAHRFDPQHASIASRAEDASAPFQAARVAFVNAIPPGEVEAETRQAD
jgi:hypothetical protein